MKKHLDTKTCDLVQCCTDEDTLHLLPSWIDVPEGAAVHKEKETSHKEQTLGLFDVEVEKTSHKKVKKKKVKRKKDKDDMGVKLGVELAKSPIECDETEHTTYILTDVRKNDKGGGGGIGKVDSKNKDGKEELEESNEGKQKNTCISTHFLQIPKGGLDIVELKDEKCRGEKLSSLDEDEEEMLWDRLFNLIRGWEEWSEESNNWTRVKSNHDRKK